ncbi:MAG: fumarylacetoacetate hydrolase family protein [Phycisphaerales bacterium]
MIAELSRGTTLRAGDGDPDGDAGAVGMARTPPVWLRDGDEVEVEVSGLGAIRNRVVDG